MTSANQTPGGYKFAPLVASQQGRANQHLLWATLFLVLPVTFEHTTACRSPALVFSATIHFAMKCSAVLRHSPSSWVAVVHWSALMPKALRSSMKHRIHSFSWPLTQPAPPTISPNITHFGSLVSSMRATNPANKIRLLRKVASMPSLPVLRSVSRQEIGWSARLCYRQPTDAASQKPVVGSAQRVVVARARAPRDAAVQHCLEYLGS